MRNIALSDWRYLPEPHGIERRRPFHAISFDWDECRPNFKAQP
jgi:hypothetical protein